MSSGRDYGCEIIGLVVLLLLSALNHFWYFMIAICAGVAIWSLGMIVANAFVRAIVSPVAELCRPQDARRSSKSLSRLMGTLPVASYVVGADGQNLTGRDFATSSLDQEIKLL